MLDIEFIRQHPDLIAESIQRRRLKIDLQELLDLDNKRRALLKKMGELRQRRNEISSHIPSLSEGKKQSAIHEVKEIKELLTKIEPELTEVEKIFQEKIIEIPNLLSPAVPHGKDDSENKVIRTWGTPRKFPFTPKDHIQLSKDLDLIDFEKATKVCGSKFYFLKNAAVLLQLALEHYALDFLLKEGFTPMYVPVLAKNTVLQGAGFNPRGPEKQIYRVEEEEVSLIATAEITLNGYYANEIIEEKDLPIKLAGISECYRREAGSWGRFSKGLYRVHHFTKVEMFVFCTPLQSEKMHAYLLELEEKMYQQLEIPYQVVDICDGDMGAVAYRKFDIEAWMPGRDGGAYGEITSCSNCTDYQARRLNIRYKDKEGKKEYVHTLNGTAIAMSRTPIAILENNQQKDGSIDIPDVLHKYMRGMKKISQKL